jgi:hypothetical protein
MSLPVARMVVLARRVVKVVRVVALRVAAGLAALRADPMGVVLAAVRAVPIGV